MSSIIRSKLINNFSVKNLATVVEKRGESYGVRQMSKAADVNYLLSQENRSRCLECMKKAPSVGLKLRASAKESRFAAVLIAICLDSKGEASILYTRRSVQLRSHVRQISFPGGLRDPQDVDFESCALRETEEEIGLPNKRINIWGTGALMKLPLTAAIMPVFGTIENFELKELHLNAAEVEEAFTIPLSKLADPSSLHYTQFKTGYSAPVFIVGSYKIWGITGFMTYRFLNCFLPNSKLKERVKYVTPYRHPKQDENLKNSAEYSMNW